MRRSNASSRPSTAERVGQLVGASAWFGSWLPDWRPDVDYRETYSAQRSLGGGVLLDAIHELDLLVWLAGGAQLEVIGAVLERSGLARYRCGGQRACPPAPS